MTNNNSASPGPIDVSSKSRDDVKPVNDVLNKSTGEYKKIGSMSKEIPTVRIYKESYGGYIPIPSNLIKSIQIIEDIESPFLLAELIFKDIYGFREKLAIDGNEIIEISVNSVSSPKTIILQFEVFSITSRTETGASAKVSETIFTLVQYPVWHNSLKKKISKGYNNVLVSEIINDVIRNFMYKDLKPKVDITATQGRLESFVIPYWDLIKVIKYLEKIAINHNSQGLFFFWHNIFQIINFKSVHDLYKQEAKHKFWISEIDSDPIKRNVILTQEYESVAKEYFRDGLAGGTTAGYNWELGEYKEIKKTFSEASVDKNSGSHYLYSPEIDSKDGLYNYEGWSEELFLTAFNDTKISSAINSQIYTTITVMGLLEITAGNMIDIQSADKRNSLEEMKRSTKSIEGKWLIKGCYHLWANNKPFMQKYELVRSGYFNSKNPSLKKPGVNG